MIFGESPLTTEFGVYVPLSIAAAAVTTLNVEPGGHPDWVELLNVDWPGASLSTGLLLSEEAWNTVQREVKSTSSANSTTTTANSRTIGVLIPGSWPGRRSAAAAPLAPGWPRSTSRRRR